MRFGFMVSSDDPRGDEAHAGLQHLRNHVERARLVADAGFDSVAVAHRYSYGPATPDERGAPALTTARFQPLALLGHLSGVLGDRVDYVTTILLSVSAHPVQLAEDVATSDAMCAGRLRLGIGLGWLPFEFEAFGVPSNRRVSRLVELITVVRALLTQDQVDFEGRHFRIRRARLVARPVQRPHPPIWIGASTAAGARRAARNGDTWTISAHSSLDEIRPELQAYLAELRSVTRAACTRRASDQPDGLCGEERPRGARDDPSAARGPPPSQGRQVRRVPSGASDEELARGRWIIGTPKQCVEQISAVRDELDINHMIFTMPWSEAARPSGCARSKCSVTTYFPRSRSRRWGGHTHIPTTERWKNLCRP